MFHSWLLLVRGVLRRTGPRGVSVRATGAWELPPLWDAWTEGGLGAVHAALEAADAQAVVAAPDLTPDQELPGGLGGGPAHRRVLVHASGFRQSPYSDVKPPGADAKTAPRKLWHASPGSSGR